MYRNVVKKETVKTSKYRLYSRSAAHVKCKNKSDTEIIGASGTVSESFRQYLGNIPGKHEIKELHKTAILGTAHTLREVLM